MNLKTVNEIFSYGLLAVGALKFILAILVLMQVLTNMNYIFAGGYINTYDYSKFSVIIGGAQIILAVGSIIMIFVNIKELPEVIPGYLWGLGAILIEFITPSFIYLFVLGAECGMYVKAGNKIRDKNARYKKNYKPKRQKNRKVEWFYNEPNEKRQQEELKKQKRMQKLEEELQGWKELLESGEIDEETYNQETNRVIEKKRKLNESTK